MSVFFTQEIKLQPGEAEIAGRSLHRVLTKKA